MTPYTLQAIRKAQTEESGRTRVAFAAALGISRTTLLGYETGAYPIPKSIGLAATAIYRRMDEVDLG